MYRLDEIQIIHLEMTTKCNARCPMCLRTVLGGKVNPHMPLVELSLQDVQAIFPEPLVRQLKKIYMCGNYGDPMMATDTLEVFRYFRQINPDLKLEMFTNGSGRNENWWAEMAKLKVKIRFGVDGLEDTNHLYRRGTKWPLIQRSMETFTANGGHAEWDFIVFRHNEHQIEEARALSERLKIRKFNVKKTGRFFSNTKVTVKDCQEVHDMNGQIEYYIEPPSNPAYFNSALQKEAEINAEFGSFKNFFSQTPIDCKVAAEKSLYISAEGFAFPCCWTANQLYPWYYGEKEAPIWKMLEKLPEGVQSLNAKTKPLKDIVEGSFFQKDLPENWQLKGLKSGRLFVCGKTCGKGFDAFKAQFQGQQPTSSTT